MSNFNSTVTSLSDARNVIEAYIKAMNLSDRHDFFEWGEDEHPYDKILNLTKELMPDYEIGYFVDHQEGDEDLIPYVLRDVINTVKGKKIIDFQYEDFWLAEVGNERLYFTAIKTEE